MEGEIRASKFIISIDVFDEIHIRMKCKDVKVKDLKNMVEKIKFEVEVIIRKTKGKEENKSLAFRSSKRKFTMAHGYQLTGDKIRREILQPQRYGCVDLNNYALNVAQWLQDS